MSCVQQIGISLIASERVTTYVAKWVDPQRIERWQIMAYKVPNEIIAIELTNCISRGLAKGVTVAYAGHAGHLRYPIYPHPLD